MMMNVFLRVSCAGLALVASLAAAQTYRWTDSAGRTVYSDTPPPHTVKNAVRVGKKGATNAEDGNVPFAVRVAAQKYPVTLYTGPDCDDCNRARSHLSRRGVPFTEKAIQNAGDANAAELKALVGDVFVPSVKIGSQKVRGFEASIYDGALDLAGYPKAPANAPTVPAAPVSAGVPLPAETPVAEAPAPATAGGVPASLPPR
ncbi:MAG: DUF4124 domain-containing protein [Zoogloeaceae bacterium]|jgi:glutaredoxin|nr:DUF4124 domain-containing protein [Zoogloeaceae bacterium]